MLSNSMIWIILALAVIGVPLGSLSPRTESLLQAFSTVGTSPGDQEHRHHGCFILCSVRSKAETSNIKHSAHSRLWILLLHLCVFYFHSLITFTNTSEIAVNTKYNTHFLECENDVFKAAVFVFLSVSGVKCLMFYSCGMNANCDLQNRPLVPVLKSCFDLRNFPHDRGTL